MIIVVLLFFQSLCLYLQNIVLKVHDKWLNPKHARILIDKEQRRLQLFALKPKHPVPGCSFCSNSPLGYCRHHNPNQPTLRHLKKRLLAKSTGAAGVGAVTGAGTVTSVGGGGGGGLGDGSLLAIEEASKDIQRSIAESSTTTSATAPSTCDILANYLDRKDPDKICNCLSCIRGRKTTGRCNRTSWGTRNGTVIWGERIIPPANGACSIDENGLEIPKKRRTRRYEKYGGFH